MDVTTHSPLIRIALFLLPPALVVALVSLVTCLLFGHLSTEGSPWLWGWVLLGLPTVALGVTLVGVHLFVRRPLRQLGQKMARVAAGDFSVRIDGRYPLEITHLLAHFNAMVAELEQLHAQLQRGHERQMEQVDRLASLGEMAAGIAHEIRNPLAGIGGAITVVASDLPEDDARRPILQEVQGEIQRLDKTVSDLLQYARPGDPEPRPCQINDLVRKALFLVSQHPEACKLQRSEALADDLPELTLDPKQVQQVLLNILLNAVQAMPEGGALQVSSRMCNLSSGAAVAVRVSDTGSGIPVGMREAIFTPFYTTKARGTGLGLAICRRLMAQQGGTIEVETTPGGGCTMVLRFPAEPLCSPQEGNQP